MQWKESTDGQTIDAGSIKRLITRGMWGVGAGVGDDFGFVGAHPQYVNTSVARRFSDLSRGRVTFPLSKGRVINMVMPTSLRR